jgi:hypothetical protein
MKPKPFCFRDPHISPNLSDNSVCVISCPYKNECISSDDIEYTIKSSDETIIESIKKLEGVVMLYESYDSRSLPKKEKRIFNIKSAIEFLRKA